MPKSPTRPTQYPSPQWARALHRGKPRHSCRGGRPDESYPVVLRPDWTLPTDTRVHLRRLPNNYWQQLLAATLTFTPPAPLPALLAEAGEEKRSAPPVSPPDQPRNAASSPSC